MEKEIDYLENWSVLNENVQNLDEETLWKLLQRERKGEKRTQFLIRLYGRYNKLRTVRERKELLSE